VSRSRINDLIYERNSTDENWLFQCRKAGLKKKEAGESEPASLIEQPFNLFKRRGVFPH
jgi:hypothetical protein